MNKVYILALLAIFVLIIPQPAHAVRIGNIMDPLCLFSWRDGCKDNINIDNSINGSFNTTVNSNVNSPGGTVSGNTSTIVNDTNGGYYENPRPNNDSLYVSCDADDSYADTDDRVTWSAYATGGTGSYDYDWSGSESLDGDDEEVTIRYDHEGTKNASVRVTSGSQSVTRSCGSIEVRDRDYDYNDHYYDDDNGYYYDNYDYRPTVSCYPETTYNDTGSLVVWRAYVSGGNGRYTYSWSGTDSLSGRNEAISRVYSRAGVKSASVTVRSNNRSTTASCGSVTIYNTYNTTYVPAYTPTTYSGVLSASCSPSTGKTAVGKVVTWNVYPTGGNGVYTYYWSGTDGFTGGQKSVVTSYKTYGTKYATVTVFSQGKSATISCGTVTIGAATTKPIVKKPTTVTTPVKEVPEPSSTSNKYSLSGIFSDVPWILVFMVIIMILFGTIMYLLLSKKN